MLEAVPESFLDRLLKEFGMQWTHLVIISGVVFSSFRLEPYVNPGIWIIGTLASFSIAYLFRRSVSGHFARVVAYAVLTSMVAVAVPALAFGFAGHAILPLMSTFNEISTLYISIVVGIPLGLSILSYRRQEEFQRSALPKNLTAALESAIVHSDFIHESVSYDIRLEHSTKGVVLHFDVTMNLLNRLKARATYRDVFDPAGTDKRFLSASVDGVRVNVQDHDRLSKRGLVMSHDVNGGQRFQVRVLGASTFHSRDSELIGSYFPCERLSILLRAPPDNLQVHFQSLLPKKVEPQYLDTGDQLFQYDAGVLPFQGVRLFWEGQN